MKKENNKNKKILARVGAMVAVVLLVALCALPAFADAGDTGHAPTDALPYFLRYYGLDEGQIQPLKVILEHSTYSPDDAPYLFQFEANAAGRYLENDTYINITAYSLFTSYFCVVRKSDGHYVLYENCCITTYSYTVSGVRYVLFEVYDEEAVYEDYALLYIQLRIDISTGKLIASTLHGDEVGGGNALNYTYAAATDITNADVLPYGFSNGYLVKDVWLNWNDFENTFTQTYNDAYVAGYDYGLLYGNDIGYNRGYDDGMSQTSLLDGVTAIFRAPMELIDGVLSFEIFGINMATAVRVLITMAIIAVCVTIVWKAVK